jgi:hypothetical protein
MTPASRDPDALRDSLRLAAKAADRAKAAEALRPAFEERLTGLGYKPLAIAHAFRTLQGSGTVAEALGELRENAQSEHIVPTPLDFEVVENEPALPGGHALTITGVERAGRNIRVTYEIRPPLPFPTRRPRAEARDDTNREYRGFPASIGVGASRGRTVTVGALTVPVPESHASLVRLRMSWSKDSTSLWAGPAHESRISL